ncbi:DUF294 nucleotidyltransferase-like domain-containing protein [Fodinibius sediminis]|uniref:CBS domain-containing protein n=1 Tax=Fodinibius sediminis TaxID=1214077 RepID=A0A521ED94_9BACT|nr:DUF294 nucleotidyltransferase-like domain-containing protein [Fodinibius sediminis]SMO81894.1 CBS domain-containing protein [Fodinibius sediminis]
MANVIVNRVKEYLKQYPPFSFLSEELLQTVASEVEIIYFAKGEYLFRTGETAKNHFYVLKEGAVVLTEDDGQGEPVPVAYCDEGDVFGVRALLGRRSYVLDALADEDSLVYAIPTPVFKRILTENNRVNQYFAAGFASGQVVVKRDLSGAELATTGFSGKTDQRGLAIFSGQSDLHFSGDVLSCAVHETVGQAARMMSERKVGSIVIVDKQGYPRGVITDKDLRNKVIAADKSYSTPVKEIMSSPVITLDEKADFATLYLTMINHRVHHLILTEDGSDQSKVIGIVSDHDLLLSQGNSPAVIIKALLGSDSVNELVRLRDKAELLLEYYLENEVSIPFITNVITEINDIIIQKACELAQAKHATDYPGVHNLKFCFLSLGSEGRQEQLLRTDMDNALIYEDPPDPKADRARAYFQALAREVVSILARCGFQHCPAGMMASNPRWCQPLSAWKDCFGDWIKTPDEKALLHASIFFDFRPVHGDASLAEQLGHHITTMIENNELFLNFLAKNALLNSPPLGFFRNLMVEKSGRHRHKFDIKRRAMMPLVDAARLLVLGHGIIDITNTRKRYEKLADLEPNQAELFLEAGKAYEIFMRLRALEGLKAHDSGRYIDPDSLGKLQRQLLKNAFYPIHELQRIIRVRFQLDLLGI